MELYEKQGDAPQMLVEHNNHELELIISSSSDSKGSGESEADAGEV